MGAETPKKKKKNSKTFWGRSARKMRTSSGGGPNERHKSEGRLVITKILMLDDKFQ